jgi:hypothetical protein
MDQSMGSATDSKFVRRVTPHSRVGSSRREMGLKRVSSRALESFLEYISLFLLLCGFSWIGMIELCYLRGQSVRT